MMEAMVSNSNTVYPWVRDEDILNNGKLREDLCLIDVRTPGEYGEAHVPGSQNIPLADVERHISEIKAKRTDRPIVLICRTQNRIKIAYDQLTKNGITNCHLLEGGITAWTAAGHPVVRGEKAISLERQVRMVAGAMIVVGVSLGVTINPWFLVIPAAAGAGLFHAGLTDSCFMGMLLAVLPFNRKGSSSTNN